MPGKNLVFIIGAARSGTHFVAMAIKKGFPEAKYLGEINDFWHRFTAEDEDRISPLFFSNKSVTQVREDFWKICADKKVVIEKTAANSLRAEFLKKAFPEAKFIFVQRCPFAVIGSVLKKQNGNINKISCITNTRLYDRFRFLIAKILSKFKKLRKDPIFLIHYSLSQIANILNILNVKNDIHWGPKFCDKRTRKKIQDPELYAFLQWASCSICICKSNKLIPKNNYTINYENILKSPTKYAAELNRFLQTNNIKFEVNPSVKNVVDKKKFRYADLIDNFSESFLNKNAKN